MQVMQLNCSGSTGLIKLDPGPGLLLEQYGVEEDSFDVEAARWGVNVSAAKMSMDEVQDAKMLTKHHITNQYS